MELWRPGGLDREWEWEWEWEWRQQIGEMEDEMWLGGFSTREGGTWVRGKKK
jgi:hypothetical protein